MCVCAINEVLWCYKSTITGVMVAGGIKYIKKKMCVCVYVCLCARVCVCIWGWGGVGGGFCGFLIHIENSRIEFEGLRGRPGTDACAVGEGSSTPLSCSSPGSAATSTES